MENSNLIYWPYDEVKFSLDSSKSELLIQTPWLNITADTDPSQNARIERVITKWSSQNFAAEDIAEINWLMQSLASYPLSYVLPRPFKTIGSDEYKITNESLLNLKPAQFARSALEQLGADKNVICTIESSDLFQGVWKWDAEGAKQFSRMEAGFDPIALFSVARRYHLLSSVDDNKTSQLYEAVRTLTPNSEEFRHASALMVRQNHYVTEHCSAALTPAIAQAKSAKAQVEEFIDAEFGHDRILSVALKTIANDPGSIPVVDETIALMKLLEFSARRNFLSFAMVVDFFERSAYQESDPLAKVLDDGGFKAAARQINRHMDINDEGGHENVALGFLKNMALVDENYATEALRIAEITTNIMNLVATGVKRELNK